MSNVPAVVWPGGCADAVKCTIDKNEVIQSYYHANVNLLFEVFICSCCLLAIVVMLLWLEPLSEIREAAEREGLP